MGLYTSKCANNLWFQHLL